MRDYETTEYTIISLAFQERLKNVECLELFKIDVKNKQFYAEYVIIKADPGLKG